MTLKEYKAALDEIIEANPKALDMQVIYSTDTEGNYFDTVDWPPTIGVYEDHEFDEQAYGIDLGSNAVLVN
jgi:hypothetical protein